jgi:glycosyltransferase involved in cell wall biosynthesis
VEYSIVISIYKDGYLARECCLQLEKVFSVYLGTDKLEEKFELIFVNDGSPDDSLKRLLEIKDEFKFVIVIDLSRNFGQHSALASGFRLARGKYVLRMNVDLQDPPSEIPKLLSEITSGHYDLVVGQYNQRNSPLINRLTAFFYFAAFRFLTGLNVPQRTSPLRVMNRYFIDAYNDLTEKSRFPQGLDQWLGFRHKYIEIEHHSRADGKSSYRFWSRTKLAVTGILYFTDRPLKLIAYLGIGMAILGLLLGMGIIVQKLIGDVLLPGYASLMSVVLFGFGIQIGCIGLLGLYVGRIFSEVQNRPLYIIRKIY